ncbi:23S rRNA (pseudouridine(1915)-N(3))-methyltransferase RlmH [Gammaproteobacteria bacterium]|nr:23S rRNA (pseudouridine(1915)-N(3))-methyltransferase RlmH [Gammaproteobacteria bacterium]
MRLTALAVGTRMPGWVNEGVQTYQKRFPRHLEMSIRELPAANRSSGMTAEKSKQKEGESLLKAIPAAAFVIALDERGKSWSSTDLATELESWLANYSDVVFLIGGADGLSDAVRGRADRKWSLSPLTLPHALVRVVLAEQLYRAWTLVQGHPYHRE